MKNIFLNDFFSLVNYDWSEDEEAIKQICYYTKTRVREGWNSNFEFSYGMEQPFAIKAIAEWQESKSLFEMGTGRGTSCYAASLASKVERIITVDIIPFEQGRKEAIGHKPAFVSNKDLYEMVAIETKDKISFHQRQDCSDLISTNSGFDLFFIDGNHTDYNVIFEDFLICQIMSSENSVFIFDDYDPNKFAVRDVVAAVQDKWPKYQGFLLSTRGHLFPDQRPIEKESGMVVLKKGGFPGIHESFL